MEFSIIDFGEFNKNSNEKSSIILTSNKINENTTIKISDITITDRVKIYKNIILLEIPKVRKECECVFGVYDNEELIGKFLITFKESQTNIYKNGFYRNAGKIREDFSKYDVCDY